MSSGCEGPQELYSGTKSALVCLALHISPKCLYPSIVAKLGVFPPPASSYSQKFLRAGAATATAGMGLSGTCGSRKL